MSWAVRNGLDLLCRSLGTSDSVADVSSVGDSAAEFDLSPSLLTSRDDGRQSPLSILQSLLRTFCMLALANNAPVKVAGG